VTSMRKLDRRLLRWRRYAVKTGWAPDWTYKALPGWDRAVEARLFEWARRRPDWADDLRDPWWEDA
jgi:hypothetical protein